MTPSRRRFLLAATPLLAAPLTAAPPAASSLQGRVYRTLKIGMVKEGATLTDKFRIAREAGFQGIELDPPGLDIAQTLAAIESSGLPVDGTVCNSHWQIRHTSPDPAMRAKALEHLKTALRETKAIGGHTVLLVVGHGEDGPEEEIWRRSIDNIAQAVPLAAELGVSIAIENVWNHFLYDHKGGPEQSVEKFVRYVDEFASPWVGMQFDIGNHWKFGQPGEWIRALGKRIIKLDIKGFSRAVDKFAPIGEEPDDLPWADVRAALLEINYHGWCAAEVSGGNLEQLKKVAGGINRVLGLA
ncbi:MAG: sugar phosphate isomerase/epimerase [Verrucomicrobia bacterium]|nr:sugar phosphate isomerase/epimerase [Verrucomicrobiota bacterium]